MDSPLYVKITFSCRWLDHDFDKRQKCEVCNDARRQDVDHVYWREWPLMHDPRYMMLVCRRCHARKWWEAEKQRCIEIIAERLRWEFTDEFLSVMYHVYGKYTVGTSGLIIYESDAIFEQTEVSDIEEILWSLYG